MRGSISPLVLALLTMGCLVSGYEAGPPIARTGGFGEPTCVTDCHNSFPLNSGRNLGGSLEILGVPDFYESGKMYTITIRLQQPGQKRWGFQIAVRKLDGAQAGILAVPASESAKISASAPFLSPVTYVQHKLAGTFNGTLNGPVSWNVNWTAPAPSSGMIFFHAAGNAANGNVSNQGDYIYTTSATSNPGGTAYALNGAGSQRLTSSGAGSSIQVGYVKVAPNSGQNAPVGTAVFGLTQNNLLVTEAGVPSSPLTTSARLFVQFQQNTVDTGVAIANPGSTATNLTLTLTDSQGQTVPGGEKPISLEAGKQTAQFVSQLFPGISIPATGTLRVASSQPVSIVALRQSTNTRQPAEALLTTLPVADLTAPTSTQSLFFPQVADGGGFSTQLMLINTSSGTETGAVRFFDDNGAELSLQAGGITQSNFAYSILAGGAFLLKTDGAGSLKVGSARAIPALGEAPAGSAIFSLTDGGILVTEAAVPASPRTTSFSIFVDHKSNATGTGLAIANSVAATANLTLQLLDTNGNPVLSPITRPLSANGHVAKFMDDPSWFPGIPSPFTGSLRVTSDQAVAPVTLRQVNNTRNVLLTTLPVADLTPLISSDPLYFPQIADGGGFTTQVILLNPSVSPQTGQLIFTKNDGTPLTISLQ